MKTSINAIGIAVFSFICAGQLFFVPTVLAKTTEASESPAYIAEKAKMKNRYPRHMRATKLIGASPREIWPIFVDLGRWIKRYRIELVSGNTPMELGAESNAIPLYVNDPGLYYKMKVVSIVPENSILVLLTLPDSRDPRQESTQFYYWHLHENNGKTLIVIDAFSERRTDEQLEWTGGIGKYEEVAWPSYLNYLEKLVMETK